ncbi:MAG TPA: MCE family protein [Actinomycetales bacterium]|nr:MCE family protein [Actinomycetales bacterium]
MSARAGAPAHTRTWSSLVKLLLFAVVTTTLFGVLALTIHPLRFGDHRTVKAVFTDASGLADGDDVRAAGVKVGRVSDIAITGRTHALVTMELTDAPPLTTSTGAVIRYRNLIGQRYVALTQGTPTDDGTVAPASGTPLADGATIPLARTRPALDLDVLFDGFKPLFAALSPQDVNELSGEIIQVLQGEGGTIDSLLAHTASLTSSIADRDAVIGRTVDNLNAVLDTVQSRDQQLGELIEQLHRFVGGLADDRAAIGESLTNINALTTDTAHLIQVARPPLKADIASLDALATTLNDPDNTKVFEHFMDTWASKVNQISRTATYGSWFNFYLCQVDGSVVLPNGVLGLSKDTRVPVDIPTNGAPRCAGVG